MKLVRYGPRGKEKPGLIDLNGNIRDLSKVVHDINAEAISPKGGDVGRYPGQRPEIW